MGQWRVLVIFLLQLLMPGLSMLGLLMVVGAMFADAATVAAVSLLLLLSWYNWLPIRNRVPVRHSRILLSRGIYRVVRSRPSG